MDTVNERGAVGNACGLPFNAQARAEETCRHGGARAAQGLSGNGICPQYIVVIFCISQYILWEGSYFPTAPLL